MDKDLLDGIVPFLAVAEYLSFTKAAAALRVTPTAVSKSVHQLEARHGVVLFQRTTRNVSLTEAGLALYQRLKPAAEEIGTAFSRLDDYQESPMGTLRLTMTRTAMEMVMAPIIVQFRRTYPFVTLDISINEGTVDLIGEKFDAGVRLGELVEKDMVAVRLTPEITWSVFGNPDYFQKAGRPNRPEDLTGHEIIQYRFVSSGVPHRWEFIGGKMRFSVETNSHLIVDDRATLVSFARRGLGLAYLSDLEVAPYIASGELEPVLTRFIPKDTGLYLYFPIRMQTQPKLRALIDLAREMTRKGTAKATTRRTRG